MQLRFILPLTLALAGPIAATAQGYPQPYGYAQSGYDTDGQSVDSIEVFFDPLARYGRWVNSRFGRAWTPNVARDWRPYTIGHWEQGAYGQTWRSDEPFGWAVFHFGRWGFDPAIGWVWTPDTVWGPGWVAWRDSNDVTGWAPLPPRVSLSFSFGGGYGDGYGGGFNNWGYDQWYQPSWVYVPRGNLYGRSLRGVILPYGRNRDYWEGTRGITRYDRVDGRVVNRSFDDERHDRRDRHDEGRTDRSGERGRDFRGGERGRDFRGDPRGDVVPNDGRREGQSQGVIGGDVRGTAVVPRRDYARPTERAATPPNQQEFGRGGFVPFQPQGGRDTPRRAPPPVAIAPAGRETGARPQAAPMQQPQPREAQQPRFEAPRPAPEPRPAPPPRPSPQKEVGERTRPE